MTYSRALPEAMLKLAKAVYPEHEWQREGDRVFFNNGCNPLVGNQFSQFTPLTNDSQVMALTLWLFKKRCVQTHIDGCCGLGLRFEFDGDENLYRFTDVASLRAVIVEAAERVADAKGDK